MPKPSESPTSPELNFGQAQESISPQQPLADRMRPKTLDEYAGQAHIVGAGKPLRQALEAGRIHSMILWGPPGTGKTTLAHIIAAEADMAFVKISAVMAGVKDIRAAVATAQDVKAQTGRASLLFIDEVHRFNKAQQDGLLPYVEDGTLVLIGATTENPSFEVNNALLSRARTYVLKSLESKDLLELIDRALADKQRGLGQLELNFPKKLRKQLAASADGDARRVLNLLELVADSATARDRAQASVIEQDVAEVVRDGVTRFDKGGDYFYDLASALQKSVRGSDPDATLYWMARMIDGGCDPRFIARRAARIASEDVGNADPRALEIAINAWQSYERLGSPEGELAIAQALVYMACAPKSNAITLAYRAAMDDVKAHGSLPVPLHIRNAPTKLMKSQGYGQGYRFAHNEPGGYAAGATYLPQKLLNKRYYNPPSRGFEKTISQKLEKLKQADQAYWEHNR